MYILVIYSLLIVCSIHMPVFLFIYLFLSLGFLGYAELSLKKLREERCHTSLWRKRLPLEHVATGVLQLIIAYD